MSGSLPDPQALKLALGWLSRKDLLEAEVAAKLAAKGFDESTCEGVLEWLRAKRVLDDVRVVESAVTAKSQGKRAVGRLKIQGELESRGATAEQIEEAFSSSDDGSELEKMAALLIAKRPTDRPRAGRLLLSRGFEEDLVETALDRHFGEAP